VTAELNIHLEDPVSTKTVQRKLHKSNIMVGLELPNLCLLKVMLRCINDGVMTIKLGHQTTGNTCVVWSRVIYHAVPYIRKSLRLENTQESLQFEKPRSKQ
jgi:hypothetical protein